MVLLGRWVFLMSEVPLYANQADKKASGVLHICQPQNEIVKNEGAGAAALACGIFWLFSSVL